MEFTITQLPIPQYDRPGRLWRWPCAAAPRNRRFWETVNCGSQSDPTVERYAAAWLLGDVFPPIVVVDCNADDLGNSSPLVDGVHRYQAARNIGKRSIWAAVCPTLADSRELVQAAHKVGGWRFYFSDWIGEQKLIRDLVHQS